MSLRFSVRPPTGNAASARSRRGDMIGNLLVGRTRTGTSCPCSSAPARVPAPCDVPMDPYALGLAPGRRLHHREQGPRRSRRPSRQWPTPSSPSCSPGVDGAPQERRRLRPQPRGRRLRRPECATQSRRRCAGSTSAGTSLVHEVRPRLSTCFNSAEGTPRGAARVARHRRRSGAARGTHQPLSSTSPLSPRTEGRRGRSWSVRWAASLTVVLCKAEKDASPGCANGPRFAPDRPQRLHPADSIAIEDVCSLPPSPRKALARYARKAASAGRCASSKSIEPDGVEELRLHPRGGGRFALRLRRLHPSRTTP